MFKRQEVVLWLAIAGIAISSGTLILQFIIASSLAASHRINLSDTSFQPTVSKPAGASKLLAPLNHSLISDAAWEDELLHRANAERLDLVFARSSPGNLLDALLASPTPADTLLITLPPTATLSATQTSVASTTPVPSPSVSPTTTASRTWTATVTSLPTKSPVPTFTEVATQTVAPAQSATVSSTP